MNLLDTMKMSAKISDANDKCGISNLLLSAIDEIEKLNKENEALKNHIKLEADLMTYIAFDTQGNKFIVPVDKLIGPGVDYVECFDIVDRLLWRTMVTRISDEYVIFPGWCSKIAINMYIPFVKWENNHGFVAVNKNVTDWNSIVVAPEEYANYYIKYENTRRK